MRMVFNNLKNISIICHMPIPWDNKKQRPHHIMEGLQKKGYEIQIVLQEPISQVPFVKQENGYTIYSSQHTFVQEFKKDAYTFYFGSSPIPSGINFFDKTKLVHAAWYDSWDDFPGRREAEKLALFQSDLITVSSKTNHKRILKEKASAKLAPNGCDWELFSKAETVLECEELAGLPHPIIGFFGSLGSWVDSELLKNLCSLEGFSKVIIGNRYPDFHFDFSSFSNTIYLGQKPYEQLPNYLSNFDICIIPFRTDMILTSTVMPIKLYEYLSAGKYTISTAIEELKEQKFSEGILSIAESNEEFVELVKRGDIHKNKIRNRIKIARENDWKYTVDIIDKALKRTIEDVTGVKI